MEATGAARQSWARIIVTLLVFAVALGLLLGLTGDALGISGGVRGVIIGAATGMFAAYLLSRRRPPTP